MSTDVHLGIPRLKRKDIQDNTDRLLDVTTKQEARLAASVERVRSAASAVEQASWQLVREHDRVMHSAAWPTPHKG